MSPCRGTEPWWVLQMWGQARDRLGTSKGQAGPPLGFGAGVQSSSLCFRTPGQGFAVLVPVERGHLFQEPPPGTWERFGGQECHNGGPSVHPGQAPGPGDSHQRLVSPSRCWCLASHSSLVNLHVNLGTKLITNMPSPAHVACLLGSAFRGFSSHLWSPWLMG